MSQFENASIVLNSHPDGAATLENFRLETSSLRPLDPGEFLVENKWLSIDLYLRPRLNKSTKYVSPIKLGK